jgi:hypothetical protein
MYNIHDHKRRRGESHVEHKEEEEMPSRKQERGGKEGANWKGMSLVPMRARTNAEVKESDR